MLVCVSLNGHQAPLDVREPFAFLPDELPHLGQFLSPYVAEAFILSTCQRFEACVLPRTEIPAECLARLFAEYRRADPDGICRFMRAYHDRDAAVHLFRVAAGLESRVLGEAQILGQVRRALEAGRAAGILGARLGRLVQHAVSAGRRVRHETGLSRGALSVPQVAIFQARKAIGDLTNRTVLLIGAGETARLASKALEGVGQLLIVNRTLDHAEALALETGGQALPFHALESAMTVADMAVCCATGHTPVVTRRLVEDVQRTRRFRPLLLIDLAIPRGVESNVTTVADVSMITLADIQEQCTVREVERLREVPSAERILFEEVEKAWQAWDGAGAHHVIASLRQQADEIRRSELERALHRVGSLAPEQGEAIDYLTRAIVNKLLHRPTVWLSAHPALADETVRDLFGIECS